METPAELEARIKARAASDQDFRSQLMSDARGAIENGFGVTVPEQFTIRVHEETATEFHLVVPAADARLTDEELAEVAGGWNGW